MKDSEITLYQHLMSIYEQTGGVPDGLEGPPVPEIIEHVWHWFNELNAGRLEGPLSYREIKAWSELTGRTISTFELELIKELDLQYLKQQNDGR